MTFSINWTKIGQEFKNVYKSAGIEITALFTIVYILTSLDFLDEWLIRLLLAIIVIMVFISLVGSLTIKIVKSWIREIKSNSESPNGSGSSPQTSSPPQSEGESSPQKTPENKIKNATNIIEKELYKLPSKREPEVTKPDE